MNGQAREKQDVSLWFNQRLGTFIRRRNSDTWRSLSQYHYLSDSELQSTFASNSEIIRGFSIGTHSRLIVLSLENGTNGSRESNLEKLALALDSLGAKYLPFETDEFNRIQVYLVFRKDVEVGLVADLLSQWFLLNKIDYVRIVLSSEPISFPLQAGFSWLSKSGRVIVRKCDIHNSAALRMLVDGLQRSEMNPDTFLETLNAALVINNDQVVQALSNLSTQAIEDSLKSAMLGTLRKIALRNHWYYDFEQHPARVIPIDEGDIQPIANGGRAPPGYPTSIHKRLH